MFMIRTDYNQSTDTTTVAFQSVKFRGRYLVMDARKEKLRLGYPHNGNHLFQVILTANPIYIALRDNRGCYVAFSPEGDRLPCEKSPDKHTANLVLRLVEHDGRPRAKG